MTVTKTDCRSAVGVTVGLIDGIIAMARVLRGMDQSSPEVQEALLDLRSDEDFAILTGALQIEENEHFKETVRKISSVNERAQSDDDQVVPLAQDPSVVSLTDKTRLQAFEEFKGWLRVNGARYEKAIVSDVFRFDHHQIGENPFEGRSMDACQRLLQKLREVDLSEYQ
jgi:hypothetical protein